MDQTGLFQFGTAILVTVAALEVLLYFWNRRRAAERARQEGPEHDLESGRRLLGLAEARRSRGDLEAAVRICERARSVLSEARRRAVQCGDEATGELARSELVRCEVFLEDSERGLRESQRGAGEGASRAEAQRLALIESLINDAESLGIDAEEAFAAGNFIEARDLYMTVKAKLGEARQVAREAGNRSIVKFIDGELWQVQHKLARANAWVLDGRPVFETPRLGQVKGVISPYFRREDGSFAPRPR